MSLKPPTPDVLILGSDGARTTDLQTYFQTVSLEKQHPLINVAPMFLSSRDLREYLGCFSPLPSLVVIDTEQPQSIYTCLNTLLEVVEIFTCHITTRVLVTASYELRSKQLTEWAEHQVILNPIWEKRFATSLFPDNTFSMEGALLKMGFFPLTPTPA